MATAKSFEVALSKLEESVEKLESGNLSLEQAFKTFTAGVKHAEICRKSLAEVELKIAQLVEQEDGTFLHKEMKDS